MVLENDNKLNDISIVGNVEQQQMTMTEDMSWIMTLLSNVYSDFWSIIPQEYLSNAWDSHIEAGCPEKPIVCSIWDKEIWFEDFGLGMDYQRVVDTFTFGKSTKRQDANMLGAYGIGAKSAYAYTDTFFLDTVKDGIESKYMLTKDEEGIPSIMTLVKGVPSDKENQSKIWFTLKESFDRERFLQGTLKQTIYFDNLIIRNNGNIVQLDPVYNGKYFKYTEGAHSNELHLLIGQVPYPIDWEAIKLPRIGSKVAIKIPVSSGVTPLPTRESVKYTKKAIEVIRNTIEKASKEILELWKNNVGDGVYEIEDYFNKLNSKYQLELGESFLDVLPFYDFLGSKFKFRFKIKELENNSSPFFTRSSILSPLRQTGRIYYKDKREVIDVGLDYNQLKNRNFYFRDVPYNDKKDRYLRTIYGDFYFVSKKEFKLKDYKQFLNLAKQPKKKWRKCIQEYQDWLNVQIAKMNKYSSIEVPENFGKRESYIGEGQILIQKMRGSHQGRTIASDNIYIDIENIPKQRQIMVYGSKNQLDTLKLATRLLLKDKRCNVYKTKVGNFKYLKQFDNTMSIEEFIKGHNRPFKRTVTAIMCNDFCEKWKNYSLYNATDSYQDSHKALKRTSQRTLDNLNLIKDYRNKYYDMSYFGLKSKQEFKDALVQLAKTKKLYDHNIFHVLKELDKDMIKLAPIAECFNFTPPISIDIFREYLTVCKKPLKNKFRVDSKHSTYADNK